VDLVIALGAKAPELLLAWGEDLFEDIPVVVINSNPKHRLTEPTKINVTPLLWGTDFKKTVQLIQDIRPQTKNLFVVSGVSLADENGYKRAIEALRKNAAALQVESLKDLAKGDLLQKVRNFPKDSAILFTTYFRDAAGQYCPVSGAINLGGSQRNHHRCRDTHPGTNFFCRASADPAQAAQPGGGGISTASG
jgi:hypothetical protein